MYLTSIFFIELHSSSESQSWTTFQLRIQITSEVLYIQSSRRELVCGGAPHVAFLLARPSLLTKAESIISRLFYVRRFASKTRRPINISEFYRIISKCLGGVKP